MKFSMILILSLLFVVKSIDKDYSIDTFIDYLQNKNYYEIIADVKSEYGTNVSIKVCRLMCESPFCEDFVRMYLPPNLSSLAKRAVGSDDIYYKPKKLKDYLYDKNYMRILLKGKSWWKKLRIQILLNQF